MGADFYDASLKGANLRQFKFEEVELDGAKLDGAHVEGANFLRSPNLEQEQLDVAIGDAQTVIPRKFKRPSRWASRP
jgi:uncharacterized protein YjbI with pentapeptide repeats